MKNFTEMTDGKVLPKFPLEPISTEAMTDDSSIDPAKVLNFLNEALATELVNMLRYRRHHFMAWNIDVQMVSREFKLHADEKLEHVDYLAERIIQLGGKPDFSPEGLVGRSHVDYLDGVDIADMIEKNLVSGRIAIESYREIIQYLGNQDPSTKQLLKSILAMAEKHVEDLSSLLLAMSSKQTMN